MATGSLRWSRGVLLGPVAGVLAFVATYAFLRSLQAPDSQVSVNAAIYRLNLAVTAVLALVFLGESVTVAKVTGLTLAVVAVLLLTEVRRARVSAGGLVFLLYKVGVADGAPPPLLIFGQFCTLTTIAFCWATWREGGVRFTRTIRSCWPLPSSAR